MSAATEDGTGQSPVTDCQIAPGYGDSKSPLMVFPGVAEPAAQPTLAGWVSDPPPLTEAAAPLAVLALPPLTEAANPLAVLSLPPLTEALPPLALLSWPPLTEALPPLAALNWEHRAGRVECTSEHRDRPPTGR